LNNHVLAKHKGKHSFIFLWWLDNPSDKNQAGSFTAPPERILFRDDSHRGKP
jgi:hypothetical protein